MAVNPYLRYLQEEIHTTVAATVDDNGLPVTCAVDLMDCDENGLYFLTAKGKGFYARLKKSGYIAFAGIKGCDALSCIAISARGRVRELGNVRIEDLFHKNPYMKELYPTQASRRALTVYQLFAGSGEWFDLSKKPIERASFSIGTGQAGAQGFAITKACTGCRKCETVCPQGCIHFTAISAVIEQEHCLHCGNCFEICPQKAVVRKG